MIRIIAMFIVLFPFLVNPVLGGLVTITIEDLENDINQTLGTYVDNISFSDGVMTLYEDDVPAVGAAFRTGPRSDIRFTSLSFDLMVPSQSSHISSFSYSPFVAGLLWESDSHIIHTRVAGYNHYAIDNRGIALDIIDQQNTPFFSINWIESSPYIPINFDQFYHFEISKDGNNISLSFENNIYLNWDYNPEIYGEIKFCHFDIMGEGEWKVKNLMVIGYDSDPSPVPEPTTMLLLGTGLIGLSSARRKMKKLSLSGNN